MKPIISTSCWLFFIFISLGSASDDRIGNVLEDDHKFWDRLLHYDGLSIPIKPPIPAPIRVPIPAPAPLNCDVDVTLDCKSSDGTMCNSLPPIDGVCGTASPLSILQFRLNAGRRCIPSGNSQASTCLDCANVTSLGPFMVLCKDSSTGENLTIVPNIVEQGEIFTVAARTPNGAIPDSIDCIYLDENKTKIQQNVIITSGDASLNLKDKFGALTLMSCDLGPIGGSGVKTCLETLNYMIDISNVGPVELEIKDLDFTIGNSGTTTFLSDLDTPFLRPGESTMLEVLLFLDLCIEKEICAEIKVEALPTSGNSIQCQDIDKYCLQIFPLPPTPVTLPVTTPIKVPVQYPVTLPVVAPYPAPVPMPTPVAVPVRPPTPIVVPVPPPTPIVVPVPPPTPIPVMPPKVPYAVPTIITVPVVAPKSMTDMSKLPTSPTPVSPTNPTVPTIPTVPVVAPKSMAAMSKVPPQNPTTFSKGM